MTSDFVDKFQELDTLLSMDEDEYYYHDLFIDAEELIAELSDSDEQMLLSTWSNHSPEWCERFSYASVNIKQPLLEKLLVTTLTSTQPPLITLVLMGRLPEQANHSDLYKSLLDYSEQLWYSAPELHLQIQLSTWSCGLSGRLLKRLGFGSWREAGL